MSTVQEITVRHPYVGEVPAELMAGCESFRIDAEWQWVLVSDGKIKAQLLAAPMHGVLMMLRLTSLPDAPNGWAVALFRRVLTDCQSLGMIGYTVFLSDAQKPERRLMRIIQRTGGYLVPFSGALAAGRLEVNY